MPELTKKPPEATQATTAPRRRVDEAATPRQDLKRQAATLDYEQGRQLLSPAAPVPAAPAKTKSATVSNQISDAPYGWTSKYDVSVTDAECRITVKAKIEPQTGVTPEDVTKIKADTAAGFTRIWDNKFRLTDRATSKALPLRVSLVYVETGEHLAVKLRAGAGRDNMSNWFVQSTDPDTRAHELGHLMGLKDEYIDSGAPSRKDAAAPGVHTDNSIMGNYFTEGQDKAQAKLRHAEVFAAHIGAALGTQYTASEVPKTPAP